MLDRCFMLCALVALSALGCASTESFCTLVGCSDSLTIEVVLGPATQRGGGWIVETTLDGRTTSCTIDVTTDSSDLIVDTTTDCPSLTIFEGDTSQDLVVAFAFEGSAPASASIKLTRDGTEVLSDTVSPSYVVSQPNGPDCEPTCRQATERLSLP
jgi:hypothetical protein